jgi:hypothetical protein
MNSTKPINLHFSRSSNGEKKIGDELSPLVVELITERKMIWNKVSEYNIAGRCSRHNSQMIGCCNESQ